MSATACTTVYCPDCDAPIKVTVTIRHTVVDGCIWLRPIGIDDSLIDRHVAKAHDKAQQP